MFIKDTLRLISKSSKRFFSLLLIVLIGAAFMMGLFSNSTILAQSVDAYDDKYSLQDIQIYSSYGFDEDDFNAIKELDYVDKVYASKTIDTYCENKHNEIIVSRIEEYNKDINQFELTSGRLPQSPNECVLLESTINPVHYQLYDEVTVFYENKDILDTLTNDKYIIVGFAKSPAYMSLTLGTSNLDNKELETVIYICPNNFLSDYYTTIYLTFDNAQDKAVFSSDYDEYIDNILKKFDSFVKVQQEVRKDEIYDQYLSEIKKGEAELLKQKEAGQKQLDEAKLQLEEARIQIIAGETNINQYQTMLDQIKLKIDSYNPISDEEATKLVAEIDAVEKKYNMSFDTLYSAITYDYTQYLSLKNIYDNFQDIANQDYLNSLYQQITEFNNKYNGSITDTYNHVNDLYVLNVEYQTTKLAFDEADKLYKKVEEKLNSAYQQVESGKAQYESGLKQFNQAQRLFDEEIAKAEDEITKAYQQLDELPQAQWLILDHDMHYTSYMYKNTCKQMAAIGYAMPFLFYLVAALVCMTTMTRLVDEQRGQIGIFRALGFSNQQIIGKYVTYALLASLIGSIIGIIIGNILFPTVIYETWRLMYDLPDMVLTYPIEYVTICILAFALLISGVTYCVTKKSLKESCASLMRPKAPKNAKKVFLENIKFIWNRLSFTGRITARNLIRYKSRFFMTVIGVAGCTGLLVIGWGVKDSIAEIINIQFGDIFNYNYNIILENDSQVSEIKETLMDDLNNRYVVEYSTYSTMAYLQDNDEEAITAIVLDARQSDNVFNFRQIDHKTPIQLSNNGVIISEKFAKNNDISKGDYITIESYNGVKEKVYVEEICEMYFQHYIFMSDDYYRQIFNQDVFYTNIALTTNDIDSSYGSIKQYDTVISYVDFSGLINTFQTMISALDYIILVIIVTAGSLAFVVLFNLTQVNISERIREIATLKVLGFTRIEVETYLFKEIMFLTIIGGLLGLPLGVVEHHFIMNVINMDMVMFGNNIKVLSFVYAYSITIIFTIIVLLYTKKELRNIAMVESLKSIE